MTSSTLSRIYITLTGSSQITGPTQMKFRSSVRMGHSNATQCQFRKWFNWLRILISKFIREIKAKIANRLSFKCSTNHGLKNNIMFHLRPRWGTAFFMKKNSAGLRFNIILTTLLMHSLNMDKITVFTARKHHRF